MRVAHENDADDDRVARVPWHLLKQSLVDTSVGSSTGEDDRQAMNKDMQELREMKADVQCQHLKDLVGLAEGQLRLLRKSRAASPPH